MKKLTMTVVAALALLSIPVMTAAQKLEPGKWTGSVVTSGGSVTETSYDVTVKGDTIGITVDAGQHGRYPFSEVKLTNKTLTFWFTPGPRVECTLTQREDGAFEGTCMDPNGGAAKMVMSPPKKD